jgi:uncharacterized membrane protein YqhA
MEEAPQSDAPTSKEWSKATVVIHLTFVVSALMLTVMDRIVVIQR